MWKRFGRFCRSRSPPPRLPGFSAHALLSANAPAPELSSTRYPDIGDRTEREARSQLGPDKIRQGLCRRPPPSIDSLLKDIDIHTAR